MENERQRLPSLESAVILLLLLPPHVKKGLTPEMELFLPNISTRFATDAPQPEEVLETPSDPMYPESSLTHKLLINY